MMRLWNPPDRTMQEMRTMTACSPPPGPVAARAPGGARPGAAVAVLEIDGSWHIDVRGLPPPEPLVAILRHVDAQGHDGHALIVHHDRDPALLYAELAQRGWVADRIDGEPGEVRLCLRPDPA